LHSSDRDKTPLAVRQISVCFWNFIFTIRAAAREKSGGPVISFRGSAADGAL
jgi:hypothetical protein